MTEIRTLARARTVEIDRVRGSRFIADVASARDEAEALGVVEQVRAREPNATHHCWAYRLETGRERASDDGEPSGTAGAPILRHLQGADLVDVVLVVTRYFGGTKLGSGGLVRAYGAASAAVLDDAPIVVRAVVETFTLAHAYELSGAIDAVIAAHAATVVEAEYGADVRRRVEVPREGANAFVRDCAEATSGRVTPAPVGR